MGPGPVGSGQRLGGPSWGACPKGPLGWGVPVGALARRQGPGLPPNGSALDGARAASWEATRGEDVFERGLGGVECAFACAQGRVLGRFWQGRGASASLGGSRQESKWPLPFAPHYIAPLGWFFKNAQACFTKINPQV